MTEQYLKVKINSPEKHFKMCLHTSQKALWVETGNGRSNKQEVKDEMTAHKNIYIIYHHIYEYQNTKKYVIIT